MIMNWNTGITVNGNHQANKPQKPIRLFTAIVLQTHYLFYTTTPREKKSGYLPLTRRVSKFGGKKLKKIDPLDLDYIDIEIDRILTDEDKIYVLDLIYYQNELCDAVLDFINNGKCSKVCNTKSEVLEFKKRLTDMRKRTVNTKIARKNPLEFHIKVDYPKGFEG